MQIDRDVCVELLRLIWAKVGDGDRHRPLLARVACALNGIFFVPLARQLNSYVVDGARAAPVCDPDPYWPIERLWVKVRYGQVG